MDNASQEISKLKELDRLKNDFIAMVSHELRTPLASVMACAETLLDDVLETEEEKREFVEIILSESNRLNLFINDVLDLARIESGKIKIQLKSLQISSFIHKLLRNHTSLIDKKHIKVINMQDKCTDSILADEDKLYQVMSNIMVNAIDFTTENSDLEIGSYCKSNKRIILYIKDSGIGINKKDYPKVFNRFEQIENILHHHKGTGLGMPISKELTEAMNGKIWFESKEGVGTTFFVELDSAL